MTDEEIKEWKLQHPWWDVYQHYWEDIPCQWRVGGFKGLPHDRDFNFLKQKLEEIEESIREDERKKLEKLIQNIFCHHC